jgi:hypothetical protein
MKLKVIQAIKGLVPGDILEYNKENDNYEIYKVEEDISDTNHSKKTLNVTIGSWLIYDFKDYLQLVDDDLSPISIERITYQDSLNYEEDCIKEVAEPTPVKYDPIEVDITSDYGEKLIKLLKKNTKLEEDVQAWQSEVIKLSNKIIDLEKQLEVVNLERVVREIPTHNIRINDLPILYFNW